MVTPRIAISVIGRAYDLGIEARELPREDVQHLVDLIGSQFGVAPPGTSLWERLGSAVAVHDPHGWARVGGFTACRPARMVIDDLEGPSGVDLPDSRDLTRLLAETEGFVFYVTDAAVSYVLAFNDHDVLIAAGTAADWLSSLSTQVSDD